MEAQDTVTLILTAEDVNIIGAALGEIPTKVGMKVVQKIDAQIQAHLAAQNSVKPAPATPAPAP